MIKKYIGITLISASLAVVGCSSNDDSGDDGMTDGTADSMMPEGPSAIEVPTEYTPAEGVTLNLVETLTNLSNAGGDAPTFNTLISAVSADAELAAAATNPEAVLTVFAPTDAAFAAVGELPTGDALASVLRFHIVNGALDGALVGASVGSSAEALNGGSLAFTQDGTDLKVNGATIVQPDVGATNGIVHVIDAVMIPPADPVEEPMTEEPGNTDGGTPPAAGNNGATLNGLSDAGHTEFVTLFTSTDLGTSLDDNAWTAFVPTNDAIPDAALGLDAGAAREIMVDHILVEGAFDAATLATGGNRVANGGAVLTFGGDASALTVNGFNATPITIEGSMAAIYIIDGVISE